MSDINVTIGQNTVGVSVGAAKGLAGDDGREIEIQNNGTHIQWRYVGDVSWVNLVALSALVGATGATGIVVKGVYDSLTAYVPNDAVTHNGSFYICILASSGNSPSNVTYWTKYVSKGDTGATGQDGASFDPSVSQTITAPWTFNNTVTHGIGTTMILGKDADSALEAVTKQQLDMKLDSVFPTYARQLDAIESGLAEGRVFSYEDGTLKKRKPAALSMIFEGGSLGAWYDPYDLSSLFQEAAGTTPITGADQLIGLAKDKSGNLAHAISSLTAKPKYWQFAKGLTGTFDFYIDAANGLDSNDGLTEGTAWKTLSKISTVVLSAASTKAVLVKAGIYSSSNDYVIRDDASSGGAIGSGATLSITYEPGTILDGTLANSSVAKDGHEFSGSNTWSCIIYGNGVIVKNYHEASGLSPNGFGNRGNNQLYVYDAHCDNCDDGFSSHGTAHMYTYDCSATNCEKGAFLHVDTAYVEHHRCRFTLTTDTNGNFGSATIKLYDCIVESINTTARPLGCNGIYAERCQIGNLATRVNLASLSVTGTFKNCFVNAYVDGNSKVSIDGCFGKYSQRIRASGNINVQNSVFSAPATGQTHVVFSNSNIGCGTVVFNNNIMETSAFMSIDATNAASLVSASAQFHNNCLSGGAVYDADLITTDTGHTVIVGTVSADPLIGAANTLLMEDYGYGLGSPAIGTGTGGGNIGFSVSQSVYRIPAITGDIKAIVLDYDDDELTATFAGSLGADCTIAYAIPGIGTKIFTGQTVGSSIAISEPFSAYFVINRQLTPYEMSMLESYFDAASGA